jgi:8-oxo-dGTP pyrophosphatase MutT (NUDIX family)
MKRLIQQKVKVGIVSAHHPGEILVLEKERDDLAGGGLERGEKPKRCARRESREELPGSETHDFVRILHMRQKLKRAGKLLVREFFFYAAIGDFPVDDSGELVVNVTHEHEGARWVPRSEFQDCDVPRPYKAAVVAGEAIFRELERQHAEALGIELPVYEDEIAVA